MYQEKSQPEKKQSWILPALALVSVIVIGAIVLGVLVIGSIFGGGAATSQACTPGTSGTNAVTASDTTLTAPKALHDEQISNAKTIDRVASELGLSGTASKIAIIAAMGESTLLNLDYGDEGQGVRNPDGSATTSKGLFQQQTPGWGTVAQVTDPEYATTSFLLGANHKGTTQGLVTVAGWGTGEITQVIHTVQSNANPNHYAASYDSANAIIDQAGIDVDRDADTAKQAAWGGSALDAAGAAADDEQQGLVSSTGCVPGAVLAGVPGTSASQEGNTYPWDHLAPPPGVYNVDSMNFYYGECTSYASWKVNEAMGGTDEKIIFNNGYGGHQKGNGAEWKAAWEASGWKVSNTPQVDSVAWWAANGAPGIGSAGHVGWVDEVTAEGKVIISEYNNSYNGSPGHEYGRRTVAIDASEVNAYLYVPESSRS